MSEKRTSRTSHEGLEVKGMDGLPEGPKQYHEIVTKPKIQSWSGEKEGWRRSSKLRERKKRQTKPLFRVEPEADGRRNT